MPVIAACLLALIFAFTLSAIRSGIALAATIGFLLIGLGLYTPLPTGRYGWGLFGTSLVLVASLDRLRGR